MDWYKGTIPDAVNECKQNGKILLVYVEGEDEMSKKMSASYNDPSVSEKLSSPNVIALKLQAQSQAYRQFSVIFPVLVIPSSFFIGSNGVPIEIATGNLDPPEFLQKINSVLEIHEKDAPQPSSTVSNEATTSASSEGPPTTQSATEPTEETSETAPDLPDRVERAKALLEIKKQNKASEEKEKEKQEELSRRSTGKAMQQAQKTKQETELQEWAKNRAKEKEEERVARERVKAQIAQDRAERAARYQQDKESSEQQQRAAKEKIAKESAAMYSNEARLQFRLPSGCSTSHTFPASATLEDARRFVTNEVRPPFSNFSLCTTFPRRQFVRSDFSQTLRDLELAPSAVLLVLPDQSSQSSTASGGGGFLSNLFWMLLSPLTALWNLFASFFPGPSLPSPPPPGGSSEPQPGPSGRSTATDASQENREGPAYRREGNVFRINNQSDDDDDNNTWNGNSTQQM